jgi:6-phosphogluconolactonase
MLHPSAPFPTNNSFDVDPNTGSLKFLNNVDSGGDGTCHLALDRTGRILFAVNYATGSVVSFAINPDGRIEERLRPAHEVVLSPDDRFLFVPDLGTDRINIYDVDTAKRLCSPHHPDFITVKAGLGPRHLLFGPDARLAYLICEMRSSVVVFTDDAADGGMKEIQTISTLHEGFAGEDASAEIQIGSIRTTSLCLEPRRQ